jgi:ribosomal protein S18 acetylase RimI-like enzyme
VIEVVKYSAGYLDACVTVLADAFVNNPLHLAAFGRGRMDQNRLFFRLGLRQMFLGHAFVALANGAVGGYVHFNTSPDCLPAPEEVPQVAATLLRSLGEAIPQVVRWYSRWCRLDPDEPHVHLGPIGVAPSLQRQGAGTALMQRYVEHLRQENAAGYLETDRWENVAFYQKFGFTVRREEELLGTPIWYMWRPSDVSSEG